MTQIDGNAILNTTIFGLILLARHHFFLDGDGTLHCLDDRSEFDDHAITGQFDDVAVHTLDRWVNQFEHVLAMAGKRATLVEFNQTAITDHVSSKDRSNSPFQSHSSRFTRLHEANKL